jgi:3-hydroxy acid dehydrogenase / malonic semialdehyde reductase
MNKIVLITGATSGIGEACATKFAANNFDIIITGRRQERLEKLKTNLQNKYGIKVLPLCFDVQQKDAVFNALTTLLTEWQQIDCLINNAGLALGRDSFEEANMDDWDTMMQTNVNGLLYVSRAILPFFIKHKKGHIINVGSIAGKEVYEKGNVYCASKFAVDAISKAMRIDLLKHNIKITAIHPGAVETEFSLIRFKGETQKADATYKGFTPLTAHNIADTIYYTASLPAHVCINDIVITCTQQGSATHIAKNE